MHFGPLSVIDMLAGPLEHAHNFCPILEQQSKTVASSLEVVRSCSVVITTTPTFAYSLVQVCHKCGTAMPYRLLRA